MNLSNTLTQNRKKIVIVATTIFFIVASIVLAVTTLRKLSNEDFKATQSVASEVTTTQQALPLAANAYFAAYSREFNATESANKAKVNSAKEYDAFLNAESSSLGAIKKLVDTKAANNGGIKRAIKQYTDVSTDRTNFYAGMVLSYADFKGLFAGPSSRGCLGIFIGSTENLAERKVLLQKAPANCYPAIDKLKKSKNSSYVDYAFQVERRVKLLEQDAASIAESEQQNNEFSKQLAVFEQKVTEAKTRNAPEAEVRALADEIKASNVKIQDNKADFDYFSKRYLTTVKEFPTLTEAVFSSRIAAKLKNSTSLSDVRLATLNLVLDDKLVD